MLMRADFNIDFHRVEPHQVAIHGRLENWGRWCNGSPPASMSPMFRLYRSQARARGAEASWASFAVDGPDAARLARFVGLLPMQHRRSLNWCYVKPITPRRAAIELGVTGDELLRLVRDARQMLLNRGA